jgi:hypothetical protein
MNETLAIAEAVRHALKTATATIERLIRENEELHARLSGRDRLLKLVQSDPGNWLHPTLQDRISSVVGPEPPYRALEDSGLPKETTT